MKKFVRSVVLLAPYPSISSLLVEVGRHYHTNNSTFPTVKVLEIEALAANTFTVKCEAAHPSLGHPVTPILNIEELVSEDTGGS